MKQKNAISNEWAAIDLHVHTPASNDYHGAKDDSEFIALLRRANEFEKSTNRNRPTDKAAKRITCIAFTDHNSVEGFKKWRAIYDKTSSLAEAVREREPNNALLKQLNEELDVLKSIRVLMGVELKAYPGVHLLFVWHESIQPTAVENFLERVYSRPYADISGESEPTTAWQIEKVLDEAVSMFGDNVLVIAPHIENEGGLYECLKELPPVRMAVLKHSALSALSFNKSETRDRVQNLLGQPEYR